MELDNLDAPQFVDFTKPLDDDLEDSYFGEPKNDVVDAQYNPVKFTKLHLPILSQ